MAAGGDFDGFVSVSEGFGGNGGGAGFGDFSGAAIEAQVKEDILAQRAAAAGKAPTMGTPIITIDTGSLTATEPINAEPDIQTGGSSFLNSLEEFGGQVLTSFGQGQNPFDPSNPNNQAIRFGQTTPQKTSPLLLLLLIWIIFKAVK
jgi:hypothetical protein